MTNQNQHDIPDTTRTQHTRHNAWRYVHTKTKQRATDLHATVHRVRRLQRGYEPLGASQELQRLKCLDVRDCSVFRATAVLKPRVLRPNSRVVETGRDGVCLRNLTIRVLFEMTDWEQIGKQR